MNRWHALALDILLSPAFLLIAATGRWVARRFEQMGGPPDPIDGCRCRWLGGHRIGGLILFHLCIPLDAKAIYWHLVATDTRIEWTGPRKGGAA